MISKILYNIHLKSSQHKISGISCLFPPPYAFFPSLVFATFGNSLRILHRLSLFRPPCFQPLRKQGRGKRQLIPLLAWTTMDCRVLAFIWKTQSSRIRTQQKQQTMESIEFPIRIAKFLHLEFGETIWQNGI